MNRVGTGWFSTRFAAGVMAAAALSLLGGCSGGCGFLFFEPCDDLDSDGHTEAAGDCRDHDPSIYPGAEEVPYDGIDQDCDGSDLIDADGDGHVAEREGGDDCEDGDASTYPEAEEVCDGKRNRCDDGEADDSDDDGDPREGCNSGYDCDDDNPAIYRGATEIPYDGVDQDCANGDEVDVDGDGEASVLVGGTDCADEDENRGSQDEVFIPAGVFVMGSDFLGENSDEYPVHEVYLSGYCMDRYEVTNEEYRACVAEKTCPPPADSAALPSEYYETHARYPVLNVTWTEAVTYCSWKNQNLPTEAQWEKAARGDKCQEESCSQSDTPLYPWGNEEATCDLANFRYDTETYCIEGGKPATVDSYASGSADSSGILNLAGNAAEWVYDFYDSEYYADFVESPIQDPTGPEGGEFTPKVIRGGGFASRAGEIRTSVRASLNPSSKDYYVGFRCAREVDTLFLRSDVQQLRVGIGRSL